MRNIKLLLFLLCKSFGLFHLARWVTRDRLKILCYHGFSLADEADFRPKLFIRPQRFEQRLALIRKYGFVVLPLNEAIERLYSSTLPKNALVITIDDGFHSVCRLGAPCLQHYGYPATVYITSYYVENANPIFRLVVQYMFWKTKKRELVLPAVAWSSSGVVDLSDRAQTQQAMWDCINYGEREGTETLRCAICEQLGRLLDTPYQDIVRLKILNLMTPAELRCLADARIDIGLHTHRHTFATDDEALARREIDDCRAAMNRWSVTAVPHFCYPSGLWEQRQWKWLDSMNIKSSATCLPGLNSHQTPRHALRRFLDAENIHELEFEAALTGFSDLLRGLRPSHQEIADHDV